MPWSLVRPDRNAPPINRSAAVTTSLEAGELAVVMITCGGRNRGRMPHDGQRCERILRHPHPAIGSAGQYYQTFRAEETTRPGCSRGRAGVWGAALKEARNGPS